MKKLLLIFISAFALNLVWENLHSFQYVSYKGGEITEFILMRASLFDAFVIAVISLPFLFISFFKEREWLLFVIGTIVAIINEWYGLSTSRWMYAAYMPIVPFVNVGLTPALQLGTLGILSFKIQEYLVSRRLA
ncbi:MAG: hypothetical protein Q7T37_01605 [bacterium]|nr:hypothetical protein [bacterium]MDO8742322.1 hypothetical protein [bacterium]